MTPIGKIAIVPGQMFEPWVRRLNENLGVVASVAKHALNAQYFMTDGVAVAKGREHLVNRDGHACVRTICVICGLGRAASAATWPAAATLRTTATLVAAPLVAFHLWLARRHPNRFSAVGVGGCGTLPVVRPALRTRTAGFMTWPALIAAPVARIPAWLGWAVADGCRRPGLGRRLAAWAR